MLKIRLTRRGKKNKAFFRLVVAEHASPIKGKFIEALGFLNPHTKEKSLKSERIKYWMEKGAQCSDSAHNMLVKEGILKGPKKAVKMKKKEVEKTEEKKEEKPASDESSSSTEATEDKSAVKKEEVKEEVKGEEKAAPEKKPARNASQGDAGGEKKVEAPKEEKEIVSEENK